MRVWLHFAVLAVTLAAIAAVGVAGVASREASTDSTMAAPRGDRLAVASVAPADADYVTIEKRTDGLSVLTRIELAHE